MVPVALERQMLMYLKSVELMSQADIPGPPCYLSAEGTSLKAGCSFHCSLPL